MFRKERKRELKDLAENQNLKQIQERIYENTPLKYPKILMINKPVNWKASGKNIKDNQYVSSIGSYVNQNLVNVYHFNRISGLDQIDYVKIHKGDPYYDILHAIHSEDDIFKDVEEEYIPTSIYEAFYAVLEWESSVKLHELLK
jgi:hypothetical protein